MQSSFVKKSVLITAVSAALAFAAAGARSQSTPTTEPDRPEPPPAESLNGVVQAYNIDPRGGYNGLIITSADKMIQLNIPPGAGTTVAQLAAIGETVNVTARPEMGLPDHAVYNLDTINSKNGPVIIGGPDSHKLIHIDGTIKRLNYGHHGEIDGAVLESGDFVHIGPREAASLKLAVGEKLSVDGPTHPMTDGHNVIEADNVNGTKISRPHPPERGPDGPPHPPHGDDDGPPPPPPPQ